MVDVLKMGFVSTGMAELTLDELKLYQPLD